MHALSTVMQALVSSRQSAGTMRACTVSLASSNAPLGELGKEHRRLGRPEHACLPPLQVNLQAFYLPFALMALSVLMGGDWISDAMGIVVGHLCAPFP